MKPFGKTATLSILELFIIFLVVMKQKTSFLKHLKGKHRVSIEVEEHTFASEGLSILERKTGNGAACIFR